MTLTLHIIFYSVVYFTGATRYGLDGPRIESRSELDFPHPSSSALGPTQPLIQWVPRLSWR